MRRLVRHGLAGVGAATFAVVAGVTALGAPATTTMAVPAVSTIAQPVDAPVAPVDPVVEAQRAATAERENREAERARIRVAVAAAADQRASNLGTQSNAIDQKSDEIKQAKAKAAAEAQAAAKAAAEAAATAAEAQRLAAVRGQGYEDGVTDPREMAQQILKNKFSYEDDQFACFDWIIKHESNWNVHAQNASSGAYGLPQSLPGSKMGSVAADWRDNPATQIIWAVKYMKGRYGSPCEAKSYWESHGNY